MALIAADGDVARPGAEFVKARAATLLDWLVAFWIFCGGFVINEHSPYELAFFLVLACALFAGFGLYRSTLGLLVLFAAFVPFALIGGFQVRYNDLTDALIFQAVTIFLLFILLGAFLTYLSRMLSVIPVFWLHSSRGLEELYYTMDNMAERPHQIFPRWLRYLVLSILPFAFVSSVPSHVLFEGLTMERFAHALLVTAGLFTAVRFAWKRGLGAYASASS